MNIPLTRHEEILVAAIKVFANYGFRRTSMQDIADAVGISRPALYLEFKNKIDIFRAAASGMFEQIIELARDTFSQDQTLRKKLLTVLNAGFVDFHREIANTSHGEELISIKEELASDIYFDWLDNLKIVIAEGMAEHLERDGLGTGNSGLDLAQIASIMVNTMHGIKSRRASEAELRQGVDNTVSLVLASLQPK